MNTQDRRTPFRALSALRLAALAAAAAAAAAYGQTALVADSPFGSVAGQAGSSTVKSEPYELAGSTAIGRDVLVCIFDTQAKHSEWIPVGGSSGAVHVVSYDSDRDRAVVVISGERRELALRKPTVASSAVARAERPGPPAAPARPQGAVIANGSLPPPAQPTTSVEHEQQEARMLVSDLLEIGMQQRKAYQEARQKAAQAPRQPSN